MSFPYLQPYLGLSNGLNTLHAVGGGGGGAAGGWVELGRTTLGSSATDITVSSLPDKRYYMLLHYSTGFNTNANTHLRFNGDTGSNYSSRGSFNAGADTTDVSQNRILTGGNSTATPNFDVTYIANYANKEKLVIAHNVRQRTAGAGYAPERNESVGKWANTSSAISSITNSTITNTHSSGSELVVLGYDPLDSHSNNFWEEIYSTTLTSDSSTSNAQFDTGAFTAKKYLWIQIFADANFDPLVRFNSDTGGNYAARTSYNGSADNTNTSSTHSNAGATFVASNIGFGNIFIVNVANKEKLGITHGIRVDTLGAGAAPNYRGENVFKWANTSSQITSMQIEKASGTLRAGTRIKIWGAD